MDRTDPTYRYEAMTAEEVDSFLDEMFAELFDSDDVSSDTDRVPTWAVSRLKDDGLHPFADRPHGV